jgi:two-component sensor histidine kinase
MDDGSGTGRERTQPPFAGEGTRLLNVSPDPHFNRFVRLAAQLYGTQRAALAMFDGDRLVMKASHGFQLLENALRPVSLSAAAVEVGRPFAVADVRKDARFRDKMSSDSPATRFFAAAPLIDTDGRVAGVLSVGDDKPRRGVSEADLGGLIDLAGLAMEDLQREAMRRIEDEHRGTVMAELDHRVKNVLAAVQAMATQSARKTVSLDSFLKTFAGRLKAMAAAQELLTATRWRGAAIGDIVTAELSGLAPGQARWEGPEFFLSPRAANALSLALHELATNAVKYGALSTDAGRVEVTWAEQPGGGFSVDWKETGGPSVVPPTRRGFGSILLEQVTGRELGGTAQIDFRPDGVRARLTANAQARVKALAPDLPVAQAAPEQRVVETLTGASLGGQEGAGGGVAGLKLLIVEDAVLLALELESGLEDAGAIIAGNAADLDEALSMLHLPIDAAVLDANLNGKSVAPVAEALRARGVPFVFATGYGDTAAPMDFDAPIVRKPYNVNQIIRALSEVTGRS